MRKVLAILLLFATVSLFAGDSTQIKKDSLEYEDVYSPLSKNLTADASKKDVENEDVFYPSIETGAKTESRPETRPVVTWEEPKSKKKRQKFRSGDVMYYGIIASQLISLIR